MDLLTHTVTATARESITRYTMSCWYTQMVLQIAYTHNPSWDTQSMHVLKRNTSHITQCTLPSMLHAADPTWVVGGSQH